ncbi:MAG: hypothetical protein P8L89_10670 [Polaribacter sp.]|nr:hypothetical protein [Polaribacter sp.]
MKKVPIADPKVKNKTGIKLKLKRLKVSKVIIVPLKKGIANMFKIERVRPINSGFSLFALLVSK